ncbi:MAG: nuclear transport factor 2 family protein [Pseudomonadota bacterium]
MHHHRRTIDNFYTALSRLDADAMADCYATDAVFEDEVFSLQGKRAVTAMWSMLCDTVLADGRDAWRVRFDDVHASADSGRAHWEADYRFGGTGRLVHNSIEARFEFNRMGLIVRHRDRFDFWRWARQAMGIPGLLLGWTPLMRALVRRRAAASLRRYMARGCA